MQIATPKNRSFDDPSGMRMSVVVKFTCCMCHKTSFKHYKSRIVHCERCLALPVYMREQNRFVCNREHQKEIHAAWVATHQDHVKAYSADYYAAHKNEIKAYLIDYRAANKAELKAYRAAYNAAHKDETKAYRAAYYAAHKDEIKKKIKKNKMESDTREDNI